MTLYDVRSADEPGARSSRGAGAWRVRLGDPENALAGVHCRRAMFEFRLGPPVTPVSLPLGPGTQSACEAR